MDIYTTILLRTEKWYNQLEARGVDKDSEYMKLLRELMEKTIKMIEDNKKN